MGGGGFKDRVGRRGLPRHLLDEVRELEAVTAASTPGAAAVGKISAKCCSFSAVSAPIFARRYAFCSILQNLPDYDDYLTELFEILQTFADNLQKMLNFHENC